MSRRFVPAALFGLGLLSMGTPVQAGSEVHVVVIKERGVGSAAQAQPYVDKLVEVAQKKNGWASSKGTFASDRKAGEAAIDAKKPQFGILSLSTFLALKEARSLQAIGQVTVKGAGGQQYFVVSQSSTDLAGCKGAALATDLADDSKFVDRVVSGGAFKLADFTVSKMSRPLQGPKKVLSGEAKCALVDDAVLAEISKMEGGSSLKTVWTGAKLPPMVVVAFPAASSSLRDGFKRSLSSICEGDGQKACGEIGIQSLSSVEESTYAQVLAAYKNGK